MTSHNTESSAHLIGSSIDTLADVNLQRVLTAFSYISKADDLSDKITVSAEDSSDIYLSPYLTIGRSVGRYMMMGVNRIRESKADRLYERGRQLLDQPRLEP